MKPGLSLRVSQHLALTPQLQQSIRLLQLSTLELSQEVEQMLDDNPFLELSSEEADREAFGVTHADVQPQQEDAPDFVAAPADSVSSTASNESEATVTEIDEPSWDGDGTVELVPDDGEWGGDAPARNNNAGDDGTVDAAAMAPEHESLQAHLHRQALSLRLGEVDRAALQFLIESLNEDGYLDDPLANLAASLAPPEDVEQYEELLHRFSMALSLLQSLEPTGVGARNLGECLSLQIKALCAQPEPPQACGTAGRVCQQPLELLARRDIKRLAQLCGDTDVQVKAAIALIASLEPKPGRRFADVKRNVVVPDVLVIPVVQGSLRKNSGSGVGNNVGSGTGSQPRFRVQLNADVMPRLRVHDIYAGALKAHKGEGHAALQQRLQEARWFIKNIQQRFDTILRVSTAIVERQKNFFVHGELAMRPLVLREIADELGLHESTISRVTTAKYMATPHGTFELKYFFGSALSTETGGNASSTAVRALIKQFVAAEDLKKPLSDNQIADMLKEQGIECARRTVAKYREALRIAPANLRKAL
jgi:RNA polymerase sigma-54 factor